MKERVYQELNAHIRDNDNKSMILNGFYISILAFFAVFFQELRSLSFTLNMAIGDVWRLIVIIIIGYVFTYIHVWFRAWKHHYMLVTHKFWIENRDDMGEHVPSWVKTPSIFLSADVIVRSAPFFVNLFLYVEVSLKVFETLPERIISILALWVFHCIIVWAIVRSLQRIEYFSA